MTQFRFVMMAANEISFEPGETVLVEKLPGSAGDLRST